MLTVTASTYHNDNDAIVEFTSQPRVQPSSGFATATKTVRFSTTSQTQLVACPTSEEAQERWYNKDEINHSIRVLAQDANRCSRVLVSMMEQGIGLSQEARDMCVGMEDLLSHSFKQSVLWQSAMKKRHVHTILIEQARQNHFGDISVETLECVSRKSSEFAREQAHKKAVMSMSALS